MLVSFLMLLFQPNSNLNYEQIILVNLKSSIISPLIISTFITNICLTSLIPLLTVVTLPNTLNV